MRPTDTTLYRSTFICFLIILCIVALYAPFLNNPLFFDDLNFFTEKPINAPVFIYTSNLLSPLEPRALPYLTLYWTTLLEGYQLSYLRIGNLILHIINTLLLFLFISTLLKTTQVKTAPDSQPPPSSAFWCALLFGLHPVVSYSVAYLIQRSILMATLFSLLTLYIYLKYAHTDKSKLAWLCIPLYFLAIFSKEHLITLPLVLAALTVLLCQNWQQQLIRNTPIFIGLLAVASLMISNKIGILGTAYEPNASVLLQPESRQNAYPLSIMTQCGMFFKYWSLWLAPNPNWMSIDIRTPIANSYTSPFLFAVIAYLAYGIIAFKLLLKRGKLGIIGFGLLLPWLLFLTEFSSVRVQEPFVLYRSYPWIIGAFIALSAIHIPLSKISYYTLATAIGLAFFIVTNERQSTLSHSYLTWKDAENLVEKNNNPSGAHRIYYNVGTELIKMKNYAAAKPYLEKAIKLFPDYDSAHGNLGLTYLRLGNSPAAIEAFSMAIKINSQNHNSADPGYHLGRAASYESLGLWEQASKDYLINCQITRQNCDKTDPQQLALSHRPPPPQPNLP